MDDSTKILNEALSVVKVQQVQMKRCLVSPWRSCRRRIMAELTVPLPSPLFSRIQGLGDAHGRSQVGFYNAV